MPSHRLCGEILSSDKFSTGTLIFPSGAYWERNSWVSALGWGWQAWVLPGREGVSREVTIGVSLEALLCWPPLLKFSLSYELKLLPGIEIFLQDVMSLLFISAKCEFSGSHSRIQDFLQSYTFYLYYITFSLLQILSSFIFGDLLLSLNF